MNQLEEFRDVVRREGISVRALSAESGVSVQQIYNILNGTTEGPRWVTLERLGDAVARLRERGAAVEANSGEVEG